MDTVNRIVEIIRTLKDAAFENIDKLYPTLDFLIENCYIFVGLWLLIFVLLKAFTGRDSSYKGKHYNGRGTSTHLPKIYMILCGFVYGLGLVYITLLSRSEFLEARYQLDFLWEYRNAFRMEGNTLLLENKAWLLQILNNILLFVPAGMIYGEVSYRPNILKAGVLGLLMSFAVEGCQLIFKLGLFEVDDLLNNTIGMVLGYIVWRLIDWIFASRN